MANPQIDRAQLELFLTSTGYVALSAPHLDMAQEAALFGSDGLLAPQPISSLVEDLLSTLRAAPSDEDAADLKGCEAEFRDSLSQIKAVLAALDAAKG